MLCFVSLRGHYTVNIHCQYSGIDNVIDIVKMNIEGTDNINIYDIRLKGLKYFLNCQQILIV
jgi:hypothetical protein